MPLFVLNSQTAIVRLFVVALLVGVFLSLEGCYYMQAIRGHTDMMGKRRPVADVIEDSASPEDLKARLEIVQRARDFAISELLLPDNESYRSYADLGRDYVVWNVFAAPEFSLAPKTWCYPVAGCVAYRGYFNEDAARKLESRLTDDGFDVSVGGVADEDSARGVDPDALGLVERPLAAEKAAGTCIGTADAAQVDAIEIEYLHLEIELVDDIEFAHGRVDEYTSGITE